MYQLTNNHACSLQRVSEAVTPERLRQATPVDVVRSRAPSPRRSAGDGRFILPPRIHRASDPGLPPGTMGLQCICSEIVHEFVCQMNHCTDSDRLTITFFIFVRQTLKFRQCFTWTMAVFVC